MILKERLVEIAKIMRRNPWMVEVVRQRQMSILHPYMVEVYVARDGSDVCFSLNPAEGFLYLKRLGVGDQAGAGVHKRGIQTQGSTGLHHGGRFPCRVARVLGRRGFSAVDAGGVRGGDAGRGGVRQTAAICARAYVLILAALTLLNSIFPDTA